MNIPILYEDNFLLVVDKPAGLLSFPLPGSKEKTVGDLMDATPVHRLDRETSGVLMLAKNDIAHSALQDLFKRRKIEKKYKTLVWGEIDPKRGEINIPLGRGSKDRLKVVPKKGGRESITVYQVENYYPNSNMSFCDVNLKTGRTHQIRVHFSAIGHPVVGDQKYSNRKVDLDRQFLHAYSLGFQHPFENKKITIKSELPDDLASFLEKNNE